MTPRRELVEPNAPLSMRWQCELLGVNRSSLYYEPVEPDGEQLALMRRMDELHLKHPFFGSRMMTQILKAEGSAVNRKRVQRLMRLMGLESTAPKPNTSKPAPEHTVYPYLLRNLTVSRINQVWAADITYIPMARGFVLSYDKIRLGFEQMLGFPVARSTLCRAMQRLARRAKPTRDALVEALRASPVVYADETGWKQGGRRVWLWVFTNLRETVYEILPGRGFEQAASVLGKNYAGTLGVDGWAPYRCFKEATLQTCYNHLLHRCHELLETATRGAVRFPRLVKAILRHALALRDRRDAGEISPHGLRVAKGLLQAKMNRLLHGRFTNPANQRFAKHLRRYRDNLFVFLDRADVEATNYPAEQDIRIAVVNRKTCGGGNRTAKGAQAQSILMSGKQLL